MSLRKKTFIIILLSVIGLILFVSAASSFILGIGFNYLENKGVQSSIDSARAAIQTEIPWISLLVIGLHEMPRMTSWGVRTINISTTTSE
jgi:hypothetical protein